jgi:pimeloyl-ACP methyl ester carboxylesterase
MMKMNRLTRRKVLRACLLVLVLCQAAFLYGDTPPAPASHYERGPLHDRVIVFVHGIFGDANGTWTSSAGAYWPKLLLSDRAFDDSDVYVANYDTPTHGNTMTVDEVMTSLNSGLTADGVFEKHREVVFVCHSLGGIVVQQLLLTFRDHANRVPFVYFFSVPEEGSQVATLGKLFSSDPLLEALFHGDENGYLLTLENQWKAAHFRIHRYCAYEKKSLKGVLVVDRLSATRNCDDPAIPVPEDHIGIVKPNNARHPSYVALRNAILTNPILHKPTKRPPPDVPEHEATKEPFAPPSTPYV